MGLFDEILCNAPLPGTPPAFIKPGHRFLTKSFDPALDTYEITAEGDLLLYSQDQETARALNYHGDIVFYTSNVRAAQGGDPPVRYTTEGEPWEIVEYTARFTEGRLACLWESRRQGGEARPYSEVPWAQAKTEGAP